ncbi:hypothetical protein B0H21DRAFT_818739 [Amylocystis lapponica]|nr:hypothetical protein B0H21DRAFT_818739 [Amylocystis lapponica]
MASRHIRRSSSRIQRWLEEQSHIAIGKTTTLSEEPEQQELPGHGGFISLDGDTARRVSASASISQASTSAPSTPRKSSTFRPASNIFQAPSPLRNFQRAFGARRSTASSSGAQTPTPLSTSPPRPEADISKINSGRSSSSSIYPHTRSSRTLTPDIAPSSPRSHTAPAQHLLVNNPSSATTYSHTSLETPVSPRKPTFGGSIRVQPPGAFSATPSLWSLPANASHMNDPPDSTKVIAHDTESHAVRIPLSLKSPTGAMPDFGTMSSVLGGPKTRKKRKLIISGIPPDDDVRFEGVRHWCETFGELNHITRVANGDLHIDFRKAEVADTVCRLQARVYINGVGSVCLSWFTGKRP